jgi:signal transduction histidine kinase
MKPARVMVVEDERIVSMHLRQQLLKLGYDVPAPIASGEVALQQVVALRPDLVLMDIHIEGGLDGIETAAALAEKHDRPVIYLTAYAEPATLDRARATKPYGYLIKPFSERELHATIQMALERHRAEKVQRDSEATLRQVQKMEAIGQLAGGVAHDFNNLLGVIIGNLDRLGELGLPDAEMTDMVQDALGAALRGASLTRHLLAYSRRQSLDPQLVQPDEILADMIGLLRRTLGETIRVVTRMAPDLWKTSLDVNQLENAVLNLAVNARDAMPAGGVLTIAAENFELGEAEAAAMGELAPGRYVVIAVGDNGMGMPPHIRDRACEPFFTTKPVGAGTGLGLSMVYGFVRQSKGGLRVESEVGSGTTVRLHFPAAEGSSAARPADPGGIPGAKCGEVVLVVEDDAALRKLVTGLIASLGYAVIEASDGPAGVARLETAPRIDLLLTDIVLPNGMSGPALVKEAGLLRPGLKVLFMSGYAQNALDDVGAEGGGALLMKPFRKADLARRIRQLLDAADPA